MMKEGEVIVLTPQGTQREGYKGEEAGLCVPVNKSGKPRCSATHIQHQPTLSVTPKSSRSLSH